MILNAQLLAHTPDVCAIKCSKFPIVFTRQVLVWPTFQRGDVIGWGRCMLANLWSLIGQERVTWYDTVSWLVIFGSGSVLAPSSDFDATVGVFLDAEAVQFRDDKGVGEGFHKKSDIWIYYYIGSRARAMETKHNKIAIVGHKVKIKKQVQVHWNQV